MFNKVLSIDIGQNKIKICRMDYKKKTPHIYECIAFDTPKNVVEDGYIKNREVLVKEVKKRLDKAKIKCDKVVFNIESSKIANREIEIPMVKENRIMDIINTNAFDYFPVDITEYVLSYTILERKISKEERRLRLLVLAAPDNLVKSYYSLAQMLGLKIVAIDYSGNSIYQIIKKQVNKGVNLVIQMNEDSTLINILQDDVLALQRTVSHGLISGIDVVVENAFYGVNDNDEAKGLFFRKELINPRLYPYQSEVAASTVLELRPESNVDRLEKLEVKETITDAFKGLLSNIQRVLEYFYSNNKGEEVETIYIMGIGSRVLGIKELLHNEIGIGVEILDSIHGVTFGKNASFDGLKQYDFLYCIGASINPLNFIPKENLLVANKSARLHTIALVFIGSVLVSLFLVGISYTKYRATAGEQEQLQAEILNLSNIREIYSRHSKKKVFYDEVVKIYDLTTDYPADQLVKVIEGLEATIPSEAVVETFNFDREDINMSVKTINKENASKILQSLKDLPYLSQVNTNSITEVEDDQGSKTVSLLITAKYNIQKSQEGNDNGGE